jgi:hypothetical protein
MCPVCRLKKCFQVGMSPSLFRKSYSKKKESNNNQIAQVRQLSLALKITLFYRKNNRLLKITFEAHFQKNIKNVCLKVRLCNLWMNSHL